MNERLFWKNKKVLITGVTGFVGSWLAMVLNYFGAEIYGIALAPESGSLYEKISQHLHLKMDEIDIRNKAITKNAVLEFKPEIVFHLAAFGFIQECLVDPERAFSTNTIGNYNVLESIAQCESVRSIVVASSDKVYKNDSVRTLFCEKDSLGGEDPYSASKTCQDIISRSYYGTCLEKKEVGMCVVRPSNILGGGDHHENRLIPSIYKAFDKGEEPQIRNPQAVRPWQDVLDMCDAYLFLSKRAYNMHELDVVNVGPKPEGVCTVSEIAKKVGILYGKDIKEDADIKNDIAEKMWLGLSIEKMQKLGWSPKMTIDDTLVNVYHCYKCGDENIYDICMNQIKEYYKR